MKCAWNFWTSGGKTVSTSMTELTVNDVLMPLDKIAAVTPKTLFKEVLEAMTKARIGIACVVADDGGLAGIITDGDIRRMLLKDQKPFSFLFADDAIQHANAKCTTVKPSDSLRDAVQVMEDRQIWDLPVVDQGGKLVGLLHLHPAVKALLG